MNKRHLIFVLIGLAIVAALWMVRSNTKETGSGTIELSTRIFDPGIVISSDGAPVDLQGFPRTAIVPLIQKIAAHSWSDLAPYYSSGSRLQAEQDGRAALIDSNRAKPFFYKNTIISETMVTLADGEALLIAQVIPREYLGNPDEAAVWRPTVLVLDSERWLIDLRFEGTPLNWFLMTTKPSLLVAKQDEFKAAIKASLAQSASSQIP